jgi:hypothetical protein
VMANSKSDRHLNEVFLFILIGHLVRGLL